MDQRHGHASVHARFDSCEASKRRTVGDYEAAAIEAIEAVETIEVEVEEETHEVEEVEEQAEPESKRSAGNPV